VLVSCSASRKEQRAEAKRKKDTTKMEQLEKDKSNFERNNKENLGK
jgi:uncharacterized membrane protein (DUF106 family)